MKSKDLTYPQGNSTKQILTDLHEFEGTVAGVVYEYGKDGLKDIPPAIISNPQQPSGVAINALHGELAAERVHLVNERKAAHENGRNLHTKKKATIAVTVIRPADQSPQEEGNGPKSSFG